jgi:predicted restriction endonuclease
MANKKALFPVYETDAWHSTASRDCKGIFTSKTAAVNAIVKYHRIDDHELFENIHQMIPLKKREREAEVKRRLREELEDNNQTQGYSVNYEIEVINLNEWD